MVLFQSTLPYGSDGRGNGFSKSFTISIHAPLRERFIDMFRTGKYNRISIHAPLRERGLKKALLLICLYFNPRSLTGANLPCGQCIGCRLISIHAPLRERINAQQVQSLELYFNPRSLTGATRSVARCTGAVPFQSTLPYGSDNQT